MNATLIRLLQLASPTLPVGAYTYSQGLEWAVESGSARDEASVRAWIGDCLTFGVARFEAVYLARMLGAWAAGDVDALAALDADFVASRESAELRAETLQMGHSLARLLTDLGAAPPALAGFSEASFPLAWSGAAAAWQVPAADAVAAYLWAWTENQVMAAVKAVPLGQTAGQRLLLALGCEIPALAQTAIDTDVDAACNHLPAFAIACSRHETQYTRLFRS